METGCAAGRMDRRDGCWNTRPPLNTTAFRETAMSEINFKREEVIEKVERERTKLWKEICAEVENTLPIPCELTEKEQQSLFLMRFSVEPGKDVKGKEIDDLLTRAQKAKWEWYWYRAAMAGIVDLVIKRGKIVIKLSDKFIRQNPNLAEELKNSGTINF